MTAPGYRLDEAALEAAYRAYLDCPIDMCGDHDEECEKTVRAAIVAYLEAAAPQPEPPANSTFWAWLCNGKGDGWEEKDKVVHDPDLIKMRRERPDLWRIEGLYREPAPGDDAKPEPPADLVERATDFLVEHIDGTQSTGWMMAAFAQEHAAAEKARADEAEKSFSDLADQFMQVKMKKDAAEKALKDERARTGRPNAPNDLPYPPPPPIGR